MVGLGVLRAEGPCPLHLPLGLSPRGYYPVTASSQGPLRRAYGKKTPPLTRSLTDTHTHSAHCSKQRKLSPCFVLVSPFFPLKPCGSSCSPPSNRLAAASSLCLESQFDYSLLLQICWWRRAKVEMVEGEFGTGNLDLWFQSLMVPGGKGEMEGDNEAAMAGWKDLPMELLLRIVSLTDDRTAIVASWVCTGWRDAVYAGLTHLSLSWCENGMNNLVLSLAPKFTKLQGLYLRQSKPQLEDDAVEAVTSYCHDLCDLDLSKSLKLRDHSLYALADGCPHLTKLNISGCSAFTDSALAYLSSSCRCLKNLNLCGCVKAASDKALQVIAYNCNQLQYLNLGWCEGVSDKGVISLALGCPDLHVLDLCGCVLITDESVVALANGCPRLRSLGLYYCQNITDRAMYSLANNRGNKNNEVGLMNLNISQCTALTPPAVQAVCDSFPALHTCPGRHSLIISGCLSLTSVHCACAVHAHRTGRASLTHQAY